LWLMERLLSAPNHEALIGDLVEQYAGGQGRLWFWRQSTMAIVLDAARTIRDHKLLAARAFVVGCAVLVLFRVFNLGGWAVATAVRVGLIKTEMWATTRYIYLSLVTLQFVALGWIVGRFHRPRPGAFIVGMAVLFLLLATPELLRTLRNAVQDARFGPYFWNMAATVILQSVGFVFGGTLGTVDESLDCPTPPRLV
jgi:hypothetical protein